MQGHFTTTDDASCLSAFVFWFVCFQKAIAVVVIIDLERIVARNRWSICTQLIECSSKHPLPTVCKRGVHGGGAYFHKLIVLAKLFIMPMVKAQAWSQNSTLCSNGNASTYCRNPMQN